MKVRPHKQYFDQIRRLIEAAREDLVANKKARKDIQRQIGEKKTQLRGLERVASLNDMDGNDPHGFVRRQVRVLDQELVGLRQDLLAAEVFREIELSKFHILHQQLDKFSEPFNPQAKQTKRQVS